MILPLAQIKQIQLLIKFTKLKMQMQYEKFKTKQITGSDIKDEIIEYLKNLCLTANIHICPECLRIDWEQMQYTEIEGIYTETCKNCGHTQEIDVRYNPYFN